MHNLNNEQINALLKKIENPGMRNLLEMMIKNENDQNQEEELKKIEEKNYEKITKEKAIIDIKRCLDKIKSLKDELLQMHTQINELLSFQKKLAGALGACYCFGENPFCDNCFGKGTPGSLEVNPEAFQKYVYPLIHKLTTNFENNYQSEGKHPIDKTIIKSQNT